MVEDYWQGVHTVKQAMEVVRQRCNIAEEVTIDSFSYVKVTVNVDGTWISGRGISKCNRNMDEYSSVRGLEIAFGRAVKDAAKQAMSRGGLYECSDKLPWHPIKNIERKFDSSGWYSIP